jgi:hypothetical protein
MRIRQAGGLIEFLPEPGDPGTRGGKSMTETNLITALRQDLQDLRAELQGTRESLTDLRVAVAGLARHQDVVELEHRVIAVEVAYAGMKEEAAARRTLRQWLIPLLVSTFTIIGMKALDFAVHLVRP